MSRYFDEAFEMTHSTFPLRWNGRLPSACSLSRASQVHHEKNVIFLNVIKKIVF